MSSVLEQIEQQIAKLSNKAVKKNTGLIRSVADGVAKIDGLSAVMYNEMVAAGDAFDAADKDDDIKFYLTDGQIVKGVEALSRMRAGGGFGALARRQPVLRNGCGRACFSGTKPGDFGWIDPLAARASA